METIAARCPPTPAPSASSSGVAPPKNASSGDVQDGTASSLVIPGMGPDGTIVSETAYRARLESIKRKADLQAACDTRGIVYGKKTKLDSLRDRLVRHWYLTTAKCQPPKRRHQDTGSDEVALGRGCTLSARHSLTVLVNWGFSRSTSSVKHWRKDMFGIISSTNMLSCSSSSGMGNGSQIKKVFFGALRLRKVQDAHDPMLTHRRPAVTVHVYDALKTRMHEVLIHAREGLVPAEDAPDIIANTFLDQVTEDQIVKLGLSFLGHRELRSVINGHPAWTLPNVSGN
ncbi:hypothetical protein K503DRAFT_289205 [Rhizopogon vinicolor AM-OR11-026]|uniref:Uncharacterized protein n=1 Tax=Rhizopogon vinicolor AM-OR11-026 TaxID=1314800 RepID=A0A1B7MVD5_9AGAM|nr:hypothetical protein K503DRAFT_289205 [Rhizopogon vinicolor AM-OR11-026]